MNDLTVANTILEQLGGRKLMAMTGARDFVGTENALIFRIPSNFAKKGINCVMIELTPLDAYTVTFSRIRATKVTQVSKHAGVYCDELQVLFLNETGLETRLF